MKPEVPYLHWAGGVGEGRKSTGGSDAVPVRGAGGSGCVRVLCGQSRPRLC